MHIGEFLQLRQCPISPTNGLLLAGLAIARVRFSQWFKVIFPFFLMAWPLAAILAWVSAYA